MKYFSIYAVSLLNLFITIRYCWLLYRKRTQPALAMWIFFTLAVGMSLMTYLANDHFGFLDNILNTTDLIMVVTVTIAIALFGDKSSRFTRFDKGCLVAALLIVLFWVITLNHLVTNLCVQGVLVIGYFPVVKRLIESRKNTEPFSVWIAMLLAPAFSLISSQGMLATIYSLRAIICVALLILLMVRIEFLSNSQRKPNGARPV